MKIRHIKKLLILCYVCLFVASIGAVVWHVMLPIPKPDALFHKIDKIAKTEDSQGADDLPPLQDFATIWQRPWQKEVIDPPAVVTTKKAPPKPSPPSVKLIGTSVDSSGSIAILQLSNGNVEMVAVGDKVNIGKSAKDEVEIISVSGNSAQIRFRDHLFDINIP